MSRTREARCYECGKPIQSVDDLKVVGVHFSLEPICSGCFAEWRKKPWWFTLYPQSPINRGFWEGGALELILYFIAALILSLIFPSKVKEYGGIPSWACLLTHLLIWSPLLVDLLWGPFDPLYLLGSLRKKPLLERKSGEDVP